ncbi:MAG: hypothetical protein ACI4PR_05545 [Acutalibacteraceae bacterium]
MSKICNIFKIKAIFLSIIGIFAISLTNVHGEYEYLVRNGFLNQMFDDKERKVFEDLYEYMNTTQNKYRKSYIEENLPKEIEKIWFGRPSGSIHNVSKRMFKFAFGEILSRMMPVFPVCDERDEDALKLASIFLDVDPKEILEVAEESNARFMGCREFGYSEKNRAIRKCRKDRRFYFIYDYEDEDMSEESFDE